MKVEIETSKGRFVVTDMKGEVRINNAKWFKKLSEIMEEEASSIVSSFVKNNEGIKSYVFTLHSLLESQGIEITNNTYIFKV